MQVHLHPKALFEDEEIDEGIMEEESSELLDLYTQKHIQKLRQ